jgi:hypothetical protein
MALRCSLPKKALPLTASLFRFCVCLLLLHLSVESVRGEKLRVELRSATQTIERLSPESQPHFSFVANSSYPGTSRVMCWPCVCRASKRDRKMMASEEEGILLIGMDFSRVRSVGFLLRFIWVSYRFAESE